MKKKIIRRESLGEFSLAQTEICDENFTDVLGRIYSARGVNSDGQLDYRLKKLLSPQTLKGLDSAVDILLAAREQQNKILIVGDFDADGATSTALSVRCLRAMGYQKVDYLVPNRFEYGYGLTPEIVDLASEQSPSLILTVDNGISSIEGVDRAKSLGVKVIVTDHHLPGAQLPDADAIVNPNQPGCEFSCKNMAGVGVVFYVLMALRSRLRDLGCFEKGCEPNFAQYLDLIALGTVADVVPLDHNNRLLVSQGLQRMRRGQACEGIKALLTISGRGELAQISSSDLGFIIGPRLNAAGRLDDMSLGIQCLLSDTHAEAMAIAQELDSLNKERRAIEGSMQREANVLLDKLLDKDDGQMPKGLCIYQADWHQGVIGILASRVKDKYHRPVIAFAQESDDTLKGSGRSIAGLHMRDALDQIAKRAPALLSKFGGHAMAAGVSLKEKDLEAFSLLFDDVVSESLSEEALSPTVLSDGELQLHHMNIDLAQTIARSGPWGQAFPEPVFDGEFYIINQRLVAEKHLKLVVSPAIDKAYAIDAIAFNCDLALWPNPSYDKVHLAYKLSINRFRGKETVQLLVDYLEPL